MATQVNSGIYRFFTAADIAAEKTKYVAAVKQSTAAQVASGGGGVLSGGTLNGQTVTFAFPQGVTSLEEWGAAIQDAENQLNDLPSMVTDRTVASFRTC